MEKSPEEPNPKSKGIDRRFFLKGVTASIASLAVPRSVEAKLPAGNVEIDPISEIIPINEAEIRKVVEDYILALNIEHGKELYTYEGTVQFFDETSEYYPDTLSIIICHGIGTEEATQFWIQLDDEVRRKGISKAWLKELIDHYLRAEGALD